MFSDLANMLQDGDKRNHMKMLIEFLSETRKSSSPPPSIKQFSTANMLYHADRLISVTSAGIGVVPYSRTEFSIFYCDLAVVYSVSDSLSTIEYKEDDYNVFRLPYSSKPIVQFWDTCKKRRKRQVGILNFLNIWLLLEHLQQVRWYAIMDATSASEVEMETKVVLSQFPEEDSALRRRVCVALNTIIGMPVTSQSQQVLIIAASVLSFTAYIPSEKEVVRDLRRFGVDKSTSFAVRAMIKTMKEQDKRSNVVATKSVRFDAILHWQRAIRMQVKKNRQDRELTARNRVDNRKREIIRARCNAAKSHREASRVPSQPGSSGPQKKVSWIASDGDTPSEKAKRKARKKIAHEAIMLDAEKKKALKERQAEFEAEQMRNLQIAEDIING